MLVQLLFFIVTTTLQETSTVVCLLLMLMDFPSQIIDEKSLIKKYQKEISCLKEELQQLRRGMMGNGCILPTDQEDLVNLKLQVCFIFKLLVKYSHMISGNRFYNSKNRQMRTSLHE